MALPDHRLPNQPNHEPITGEPKIFLPKNVALHIFFTRHVSRKDLGDFDHFRNLVHDADIFVPESTGWVDDTWDKWNKVSKGDYKIYTRIKENILNDTKDPSNFDLALFDATYASRAQIVFIDVQGEEFNEKHDQITDDFDNFIGNSFEEQIAKADDFCHKYAQIQTERENHMLKQLGPILTQVIDPHPKLRVQDKVSVLMLLGSAHTRIVKILQNSIKLNESGLPNISYEFTDPNNIPSDELTNKYKDNEMVGDKERHRLLLEMVGYKFMHHNLNKKISEKILTKVVKILSEEEIIDLFITAKQSLQKKLDLHTFPIWQKVNDLAINLSQK